MVSVFDHNNRGLQYSLPVFFTKVFPLFLRLTLFLGVVPWGGGLCAGSAAVSCPCPCPPAPLVPISPP